MSPADTGPAAVHYLPIATTAISIVFLWMLVRRYARFRSGPHLLWWAAGIFAYGLGTAIEAAITLGGNSVWLTKAWYIAGALLGGYPLAQGTVYLLLGRRTAHLLTALTVPFIVVCAAVVCFWPVNLAALEPHRPGVEVLQRGWVRHTPPVINSYAAFFLIGGAIFSAIRYALKTGGGGRALGNSLIAAGALLPAIGGWMARKGGVEALYIGEFAGLLLIWAGYGACVGKSAAARPTPAPRPAETGN